ncbi:MAG: Rrf2 family transcriptional regulator [Firmicutes bacterium]|nr:Rrf2 family transcriptional regulator [Bacillota bacterium]
MRISTKGRYGLAVMLCIAEKKDESQTVALISKKIGASKIYLEQVFGLLKNARLLQSSKGAQGGYFLTDKPDKITVYDILYATETTLFETTEKSFSGETGYLETTVNQFVWQPLNQSIAESLKSVTLSDLLDKSRKTAGYMFHI